MKNIRELIIFFIVLSIVGLSCIPLFYNLHNVNLYWDWLHILSFYKAARDSIITYHQFPYRTHFFAGGYPVFSNPQDGTLSPFFIPVLLFGENMGAKINIFLVHLLGASGMYYLTRGVLGFNLLGAIFSSLVFCLGGNAHRLLVRGQDYICSFYYFFFPIILAFFIKSKDNKKYIIFCVVAFTILLMQAGLYALPLILFLFLFSCFNILRIKEKKLIFEMGYLRNLFIVGMLSFLLGAVKFLPMLDLLIKNSRTVEGYNPFWSNLYEAFFARFRSFPFVGQHQGYYYLGFIPFILLFLSFLIYWRKNFRYLILLIIFSLLSFGPKTRLDLFRFLFPLPLFHSIEAPTRYFAPIVIFIISLNCGWVFLLCQRYKSKILGLLFSIIAIISIIDLFYINRPDGPSFPFAIPEYKKQKEFFYVRNLKAGREVSPLIPRSMYLIRSWEWTRPTQYELMLQNIGKLNAHIHIHLKTSVVPKYYIEWNGENSLDEKNYIWHLNPQYRGEIYFLKSQINKAEFVYFSPHKIIIKADIMEPDLLIINQNYDKHWNTDYFQLLNYQGLLSIGFKEKGNYLIRLRYIPWLFYCGLSISLSTILFVVLYFKRCLKKE